MCVLCKNGYASYTNFILLVFRRWASLAYSHHGRVSHEGHYSHVRQHGEPQKGSRRKIAFFFRNLFFFLLSAYHTKRKSLGKNSLGYSESWEPKARLQTWNLKSLEEQIWNFWPFSRGTWNFFKPVLPSDEVDKLARVKSNVLQWCFHWMLRHLMLTSDALHLDRGTMVTRPG